MQLVDFGGSIVAGEIRVTIAVTDMQSGELVLFDTSSDKIGVNHILASCGFLPVASTTAVFPSTLHLILSSQSTSTSG
jgi:hypothetical protein